LYTTQINLEKQTVKYVTVHTVWMHTPGCAGQDNAKNYIQPNFYNFTSPQTSRSEAIQKSTFKRKLLFVHIYHKKKAKTPDEKVERNTYPS